MRSNSGSGKSNNNLGDPTMKEHEKVRDKLGHRPAHGRTESAPKAESGQRQPAETGSAD